MPLLMCPNCHEGMKEINRESVMIDICPKCQGIWLDRGELNKLLETVKQDNAAHFASPPHAGMGSPSVPYRDYEEERYRSHGKYHKKSKLESIFDIFD